MPYKLIVHRDGTFSVKNLDTGKYTAKKTTKERAVAQLALLNLLEKKK